MNPSLQSRLKLLKNKQNKFKRYVILPKQPTTKALGQQTQWFVQAIQYLNRAIRELSDALNKTLQKSIKEYDEIITPKNQLVTNFVNSNQIDFSIVKTVSNLLNDKNKRQFSLEPVTPSAFGEDNPNLFTLNPTNPQQVIIKNTTLTSLGSGNKYNLYDLDLHQFITNTQFDREKQNVGLIYTFLNDMQYNINTPGDRKSDRYNFIKALFQPN